AGILVLLAVSCPAFILATWPLWWGNSSFPQVPFLPILARVPVWVDQVLVACVCGASIGILYTRWRQVPAQRWLIIQACLLGGLILLNQHRLQPWAYQFVLLLLTLAFAPSQYGLRWMRWLAISVYFYSALSKLDHTFITTLGGSFLDALLGSCAAWVSESLRPWLVAIIPLAELSIAVGLVWQRARKLAVIGALAMHGALIWILGPWNLDHSWGVLLWNVFFALYVVLLFWKHSPAEPAALSGSPGGEQPVARAMLVLWCFVLLAPLGRFAEWYDEWPSWALYAPSGGRVELLVSSLALHRLPAEVRSYLQPVDDSGEYLRLRMDRWSLHATRAPVYPQPRFQYAVAMTVIRESRVASASQVLLLSPASVRSGERDATAAVGAPKMNAIQDRFWFNTTPRRTSWIGQANPGFREEGATHDAR
ncbi:MAG: hypothetical protein KDA42_15765, partial [Planctomycetales bacterium]|nr:hypothetical protein [Planctomycetales bacterium]